MSAYIERYNASMAGTDRISKILVITDPQSGAESGGRQFSFPL